VRGRRLLFGLLLSQAVAMLFFYAVVPIEVVYAKDTLGASDAGYGWLLAAWGAGMLGGGFLFAGAQRAHIQRVLAVGTLAIYEVLGREAAKKKLDELVGHVERVTWHGREVDVIALPHPSGASPWHKMEPGKTLLAKALGLARRHPAMRAAIG
jgi:hypothetical protein